MPTHRHTLGYDAVVQGPNSMAPVDQGIANMDYQVNDKDRLSGKYYIQNNPTTNPFGAVGSLLGFPQQLSAGSDVATITNTVILSPTVTWEQHVGFTRLRAYAATRSGLHSQPDRHQSAGLDDVPPVRNHHVGSDHSAMAWNSAPAPVLAMPACTRINGNTNPR